MALELELALGMALMNTVGNVADPTREPLTLKNGSKKDPKSGKFLPGAKPDTAFTKESARAAAEKRWEAAKQAALAEVEDRGPNAWGKAVGAVFDGSVRIADKRPENAAKALAWVGAQTGLGAPVEREGNRAVVAVQVNVSSAAPAQVYRIAAAAGEVVEGELAGDA